MNSKYNISTLCFPGTCLVLTCISVGFGLKQGLKVNLQCLIYFHTNSNAYVLHGSSLCVEENLVCWIYCTYMKDSALYAM